MFVCVWCGGGGGRGGGMFVCGGRVGVGGCFMGCGGGGGRSGGVFVGVGRGGDFLGFATMTTSLMLTISHCQFFTFAELDSPPDQTARPDSFGNHPKLDCALTSQALGLTVPLLVLTVPLLGLTVPLLGLIG